MWAESMKKSLRAASLFIVFLCAATVSTGAQEPPPANEVAAKFAGWSQALDRTNRELAGAKIDGERLDQIDEELAKLFDDVGAFKAEIDPFGEEARDLRDSYLASLQKDAPETDEIKAQKKALDDRVSMIEGWQGQIDLIFTRAGQLQDKVSARRISLLLKALTARGEAAANPFVWLRAGKEALSVPGALARQAAENMQAWPAASALYAQKVWLFAVLAAVAAWFAVRFVARRRGQALEPALAGPWSRAVLGFLSAALPLAAAALCLGLASGWGVTDLLPPKLLVLAGGLLSGLLIAGLGFVGLTSATEPLPASADRLALRRFGAGLLILLGLEFALGPILAATESANVSAVWALVFTALALIFTRLFVRALQAALGEGNTASRVLLLAGPSTLLMVLAVAVVAALAGYGPFARYLTANLFATVLLLAAAGTLREALREFLPKAFDVQGPAGRALSLKLGADQATLRLIQFWLGILLDIVIPLLALFGLTVVWGAGSDDAITLGRRLVDGIRIGNVTLSLTGLLLAIFAFMIGVWITRAAQRFLDTRIFPDTQLDTGVRNSLRSGLGYVGVMIAAAVGISVLGINLSSLGLIVGALSVGIGFGLQNIVNNFVSGLILLIERPVKVGDRILVAGNEGIVKRINVRATEIINQHRASVLVPNADFLGGAVTNWTHKDQGARLHLAFQTPGTLGAEKGRDLLIGCAIAHPEVQKAPVPFVLLKEIGGSYSFELVADIENAERMDEVASDLRFAVDKALRQLPA